MAVPFVDLKAQYRSIQSEIDAAIREVIENTAFVLGPAVERFEKEFAAYLEVEHVVGVSSGTTALQLAMVALEIGSDDEVIVPAHTFIATAEAVSHVGARPVFVEVLDETGNLDPALLENAINESTRAVIPVHLYGHPANLDPIRQTAAKHRLAVIEDACQAHGARYHNRRVGGLGDVGCFSFYPGKNLGAYGEGGALVTNDPDLAARLRRLRDHGQSQRYHHSEIGYNARLEGIQGAVLGVKLRHLDQWNAARRAHAAYYSSRLAECDVRVPVEQLGCESVYHLYVVRSLKRDSLQTQLTNRGIQTGLHYPVPLHLQPAYSSMGYREGDFPAAEWWARNCLSLPMYAELTEPLLDEVIAAVRASTQTRVAPAMKR